MTIPQRQFQLTLVVGVNNPNQVTQHHAHTPSHCAVGSDPKGMTQMHGNPAVNRCHFTGLEDQWFFTDVRRSYAALPDVA